MPVSEGREIPVLAAAGNLIALVDEEDFGWASSHRWYKITRRGSRKGEGGDSAHAGRHARRGDGRRTTMLMHREIYVYAFGLIPDGMHVDHENRNSFDNRRSNLRLATPLQNGHNTRPHRDKVCSFKGVDLVGTRWRARIQLPTGRLWLGSYDTPEEAARAYDRAAREHFGAFAVLNFPEDQEATCFASS